MKERNGNPVRQKVLHEQRFKINQQEGCSTVLQGNNAAPFPKEKPWRMKAK